MPFDQCDNLVIGPYCVKYVICYYREHTATMNDFQVQTRFNQSYTHAKIFSSFQQTNQVLATYDSGSLPPLCILDGSYIKCIKLVNWERDVEMMRRQIQNGEDIDMDYLRRHGK